MPLLPITWTVEPTAPHTHTIIFLPSLAREGEEFGRDLLDNCPNAEDRSLPEILPGCRFVFPTARFRLGSGFDWKILNLWFDMARLSDPEYKKKIQLPGLESSAVQIMDILNTQLQEVPPENIILAGFGQGCAMALAILMSLDHSLGGFVGMSGWLPYQSSLEEALESKPEPDELGEHGLQEPCVRAQTFLRDLFDLPALDTPEKETTAYGTPIFLAHGTKDTTIPVAFCDAAAKTVRAAGYKVTMKQYDGMAHGVAVSLEIDEILEFIGSRVGWDIPPAK
jgi:predicted esterase